MPRNHEHDNKIIELFSKLRHVPMSEWDGDFFKKLQNSWQSLKISLKQLAYLEKLHKKYCEHKEGDSCD